MGRYNKDKTLKRRVLDKKTAYYLEKYKKLWIKTRIQPSKIKCLEFMTENYWYAVLRFVPSIFDEVQKELKKRRRGKKNKIQQKQKIIVAKRGPTILEQADKKDEFQKLIFFRSLASNNISYKRLDSKKYQKLRSVKNELNSDRCYICGGKSYCMHHIIPLICGGKNRKRNLIPVCEKCHKYIHPFMQ